MSVICFMLCILKGKRHELCFFFKRHELSSIWRISTLYDTTLSIKKMPIPVGKRVVKTSKKFNSTETGSVKVHNFARWNGVTLQIVSQQHFDLEETPGRWSHQESFREQQAFE